MITRFLQIGGPQDLVLKSADIQASCIPYTFSDIWRKHYDITAADAVLVCLPIKLQEIFPHIPALKLLKDYRLRENIERISSSLPSGPFSDAEINELLALISSIDKGSSWLNLTDVEYRILANSLRYFARLHLGLCTAVRSGALVVVIVQQGPPLDIYGWEYIGKSRKDNIRCDPLRSIDVRFLLQPIYSYNTLCSKADPCSLSFEIPEHVSNFLTQAIRLTDTWTVGFELGDCAPTSKFFCQNNEFTMVAPSAFPILKPHMVDDITSTEAAPRGKIQIQKVVSDRDTGEAKMLVITYGKGAFVLMPPPQSYAALAYALCGLKQDASEPYSDRSVSACNDSPDESKSLKFTNEVRPSSKGHHQWKILINGEYKWASDGMFEKVLAVAIAMVINKPPGIHKKKMMIGKTSMSSLDMGKSIDRFMQDARAVAGNNLPLDKKTRCYRLSGVDPDSTFAALRDMAKMRENHLSSMAIKLLKLLSAASSMK